MLDGVEFGYVYYNKDGNMGNNRFYRNVMHFIILQGIARYFNYIVLVPCVSL